MAERNERKTVMLSNAEMAILMKAAKAVGLSVASYMRTRAVAAAAQETSEPSASWAETAPPKRPRLL